MIVVVATLTAWLMALLLRLQPMDFLPLGLPVWARILLRLAMSFCGVFGFSLMFNSPVKLASVAAVIGALSNTLRLELLFTNLADSHLITTSQQFKINDVFQNVSHIAAPVS